MLLATGGDVTRMRCRSLLTVLPGQTTEDASAEEHDDPRDEAEGEEPGPDFK